MKNHPMQQFHDLLSNILETGKRRPNRTGTDTLFVHGQMLRFDMADGFPAITTKQLFFKAAKGELFGFFRGYTNAAQFRELGCKVWDGNANETKSWLENPYREGHDSLGRIYSAQWTDWRDWRSVTSQEEADKLSEMGYDLVAFDPGKRTWVFRRGMNQLEIALEQIMTDPTNRRIMITGWRPDEHDQACIPVCHVTYQFLIDVEEKTLHMCFFQRSFDTALAFNISLGALLLHLMAKLSGYEAGVMTHFIGDAHVYVNHIEGVREMLSREHFAQPDIDLSGIPTLSSAHEIPGIFEKLDPDTVKLVNYRHHPAIRLAMAA